MFPKKIHLFEKEEAGIEFSYRLMALQLEDHPVGRLENGSLLQQASERLHVSAIPDVLPCREDEYYELLGHLTSAIQEKSGCCIYISGVPGTGKTATFRAVLRTLENDEVSNYFKKGTRFIRFC